MNFLFYPQLKLSSKPFLNKKFEIFLDLFIFGFFIAFLIIKKISVSNLHFRGGECFTPNYRGEVSIIKNPQRRLVQFY